MSDDRELLGDFHPSNNGRAVDRNTDPVAWNKAWDGHLKRMWDIALRPTGPFLARTLERETVKCGLSEQYAWFLLTERRRLYAIQRDLRTVVDFVEGRMDFDSVWFALPVEQQRSYLLSGALVTFGHAAREQDRSYCPEVAIKNLLRGGGRGYVNLTKTLCLPAGSPAHGSTPIYLSHPVVDIMFDYLVLHEQGKKHSEEKLKVLRSRLLEEKLIRRNIALTLFVDDTLRYISGLFSSTTPPQFREYKEGGEKVIAPIWRKLPRRDAMREVAMDQENHGAKDVMGYMCARCDTIQDPEKERFLVCAGCKGIQRTVVYCSRACQADDWKNGDPPHQSYCRNSMPPLPPIKLTAMSQTGTSTDMSVPPGSVDDDGEDDGTKFVQSSDLLLQVRLLRQDSRRSYVYISSLNRLRHAGGLSDDFEPSHRPLFEAVRDEAMTHGKPNAMADL